MHGFADSPGSDLQLVPGDDAGLDQADIVDVILASHTTTAPLARGGEKEGNLFAAGQRIAARAADRRPGGVCEYGGQYAGLYRRFGD